MEISKRSLVVVCAIALILFVGAAVKVRFEQDAQNHRRDTDANINCKKASERTALAAAYIISEGYENPKRDTSITSGFAQGLISTIPVPAGHSNDPAVVDVERIENSRHVVIYRLSEQARALQAAGCDLKFPPT